MDEHYRDGFDTMVVKTLEFVAYYLQTATQESRSRTRRDILETSWLRADEALELHVQNFEPEAKKAFRDGMKAARSLLRALCGDPPPR